MHQTPSTSPSDDAAPAQAPRPRGRLFCIPTPLGDDADPHDVLPAPVIARIAPLTHFVAESARQARAFLKRVGTDHPIQSLDIQELNEHSRETGLPDLLRPLLAGHDLGLMSDAGCPGVADPGAALVALAHRNGITVIPLVGPSSLLLALMAGGLNGQRFGFVGYLPVPSEDRARALRELEQRSARDHETLLWIETPYRNAAMLDQALAVLQPTTTLSVAAELTLGGEQIHSASVAQWRARPWEIAKAPAVFSLLAAPFKAARDGPRTRPRTDRPANAQRRRRP